MPETNHSPVILFPLNGCPPTKAMSQDEMEKEQKVLRETIKSHWNNEGVQSIIKLLEREAAVCQGRACHPDGDKHVAGQAFGLAQFVARINLLKLAKG